MPNWKKVILSGSNAHINNLTASGHVSALNDSFTVNNHTSTELLVEGNITASNILITDTASITYFETTYASSSIIYSSGSTKFGDTMDDFHDFTGSVNITGSTNVVGNITASGNIGANGTGYFNAVRIPQDDGDGTQKLYFGSSPTGDSGYLYDDGSNLQLGYNDSDIITIHDAGTNVSISGDLKTSSHITASGNISSSDNILANQFKGNKYLLQGNDLAQIVTLNGVANTIQIGDGTTPNQLSLTGTNITTVVDFTSSANISASGYISASEFIGLVNTSQTASYILADNIDQPFTNITASGNISASGNVLTSNVVLPLGGKIGVQALDEAFLSFTDGGGGNINTSLQAQNIVTIQGQGGQVIGTAVGGGHTTVHGNISASGALFASLSLDNSNLNTVMYNTSTGKFFYTGSYGGGGGGGGGTPAGVNKSIQFNDSGVFGGNNLFNYDSTFNSVSVTTSQAGTIGLASPNNGSSLFINTNRDLFLAERATPDTIFGVFDRLNRYLCLQPHTVNGSANTVATTHQPTARLHVLDKPQNTSGVLMKSINQNPIGRFNLLLGTAMPLNSTGTHRFISFHHTSGNDGGTALNGGIFFDPNNNIQGGLQGAISSVVFQGVFIQSSDKKLKKHITFTKKGVDDIMSIKVKDFRWKEQLKDTPKNTGFIAQDLLETHPEMIRNIDGTLNVEYDKMIPLLVKAIQDQQHQIDDLKEQLKNKQL